MDAGTKGEESLLKKIDPLLNADVLHALRAMGHGDRVVLCDTNFPADSVARQTVLGRLLRIDAADCPRVARAILSVMPLDTFIDDAAARMEVVGKPQEIPAVQEELLRAARANGERAWAMGSIERHAFYARAKRGFAVVTAMAERRPYGCFVLVKGVIGPDGQVV